jgi:hypothetical protein
MNKKFWYGVIATFVILAIIEFVVNMYLMASTYQATASLWRPMPDMKLWVFYICYLFGAVFLTLIYSKWHTGKGIMEGIQYGVYTGLLISVPSALGMWGSMPISYRFAIMWIVCGFIKFLLCGIALSLIYGRKEAA